MKRIVVAGVLLCLSAAAQAQMYWRFDLGVSFANNADFKDKDPNFNQIIADPVTFAPGKLDDLGSAFILGGGVGYRFNDNVRGDATLAYRSTYQLTGRDAVGTLFESQYSGPVTSLALMVNGYYDFRAVGGVRPFVGAGVGVAENKLDKLLQNFPGGGFLTFGKGTKTNTAFAAMAGVSIPAGRETFEVGYRYVDLGKFETGTGLNFPGFGNVSPAYPGASGKLTAHELTFGMRF